MDKQKRFDYSLVYKTINGIPVHEFFHDNSSLNEVNAINISTGIDNAWRDDRFRVHLYQNENFVSESAVALSHPDESFFLDESLPSVLLKRRSVRAFADEPVSGKVFSNLLYFSFGINGHYNETKEHTRMNLYAFPTAGGICSLMFYVVVLNVDGIANGIYLYNPIRHCLNIIRKNFIYDEYSNLTTSLSLTANVAFSIHIVGDMKYTGYKYGNRGYRFMHLEAGHAVQNIYLTSTGMSLGAIASGGFLDNAFFKFLNIDCEQKFLIYEVFVGTPDFSVDYRFER